MRERSYLETQGFDGEPDDFAYREIDRGDPDEPDSDDLEPGEIRYGNVGVRLYAFVIDSLVLFALNCIALVFLGSRPVPSDPFEFWMSFFLFEFAISAVYMSAMESSPLQGSLGKLMSGLKVTDLHGQRIGILQAFGRNVREGHLRGAVLSRLPARRVVAETAGGPRHLRLHAGDRCPSDGDALIR